MAGKSQFRLFFGSQFFSGVIVLEGECCVFKHCASVLWYVSFLVRVWWSSYIDSSICNVSLLSPLRLPLVKISLYHWFGQFCYYVHWFPSFLLLVFGNLLFLRVYSFTKFGNIQLWFFLLFPSSPVSCQETVSVFPTARWCPVQPSFQASVTLPFVALPVGALLQSLWLAVWHWAYSLKGSLLGCLERRLSGILVFSLSPQDAYDVVPSAHVSKEKMLSIVCLSFRLSCPCASWSSVADEMVVKVLFVQALGPECDPPKPMF